MNGIIVIWVITILLISLISLPIMLVLRSKREKELARIFEGHGFDEINEIIILGWKTNYWKMLLSETFFSQRPIINQYLKDKEAKGEMTPNELAKYFSYNKKIGFIVILIPSIYILPIPLLILIHFLNF